MFIQDGVRVYITGRRRAELDEVAASLGATAVAGDVSQPADLVRLYDLTDREVGRLDVVFAHASSGDVAPPRGRTEAHIDALLDINVKCVIWTVQKALRLMDDGGSIILTAFIVARRG